MIKEDGHCTTHYYKEIVSERVGYLSFYSPVGNGVETDINNLVYKREEITLYLEEKVAQVVGNFLTLESLGIDARLLSAAISDGKEDILQAKKLFKNPDLEVVEFSRRDVNIKIKEDRFGQIDNLRLLALVSLIEKNR
jgi:hypothetical protein